MASRRGMKVEEANTGETVIESGGLALVPRMTPMDW
jgi:hypothetical protein